MNLVIVLAVVVLLIAVNALYVAAEFGAVGARKTRVQTLADAGNSLAKLLLPYLEDPKRLDFYISASQVGITISSLAVGFYGQAQLSPYLGPWLAAGLAAVIVLAVLSSLQVVFAELLPKSVALRYPERLALWTVTPMVWSIWILRPFIVLLDGSATLIMRLFGVARESKVHVHSPDELEMIFSESASGGFIDVGEQTMLANVFEVERRLCRQIMVPRTRMITAEVSEKPGALLARLIGTVHTRFPVFEGNIDHVLGMVHLKDLFLYVREQPDGDLREILRDVPIIPETNTVGELWDELKRRRSHMAVLFDEYGGTVGMVTLEDIIEEIVGELEDEFDNEDKRIRRDESGRIYVRGDVLIDTLNKLFLLNLPKHDVDTVGGLVFEALGRTPRTGDTVQVNDLSLRIDRVEENVARQVSFSLPVPEPANEVGLGETS